MVEVGFMFSAGRDIEQAILDFETEAATRRYDRALSDESQASHPHATSRQPWWQDRLDLSATPTQASSSTVRPDHQRERITTVNGSLNDSSRTSHNSVNSQTGRTSRQQAARDNEDNDDSSSDESSCKDETAWWDRDLLADPVLRSQGDEAFLVQAFLLSGRLACELRCQPAMTVAMVKWHISRTAHIPVAEQQLVLDGSMLEDESRLADHLSALHGDANDRTLVLQIVRSPPSSLSAALLAEGRAASHSPEESIKQSLVSVVDSVMTFEHELSERRRPKNAEGIEAAITQSKRGDLVNWMVMACHAMKFDDSVLHSAILNADRYYESLDGPLEMMATQSILLGIFASELKLFGADHFPRSHWKHVIRHLAHSRIPLPEIMRMEYEVLAALDFCMEVPTPLTFLRELGIRMPPQMEVGRRATELATFFLELSMFQVRLQYSRAHSVLAAGALSAAYRILEATGELSSEECEAARAEFVQDLRVYDRKLPDPETEVLDTEEEILGLWAQAARSDGEIEWRVHYHSLQAKFADRSHLPFQGQTAAAALAGRALALCQAARE